MAGVSMRELRRLWPSGGGEDAEGWGLGKLPRVFLEKGQNKCWENRIGSNKDAEV